VNHKSVVAMIHSHRINLMPRPLCFRVKRHCLESFKSGFHRLESSVHILALFVKLSVNVVALVQKLLIDRVEPSVDRLEPSVDRLESSVHVLALFDKLFLDSVILEVLMILMAFDENHKTRINTFKNLPGGRGWSRLVRISGKCPEDGGRLREEVIHAG
jgi:hypothetical protein